MQNIGRADPVYPGRVQSDTIAVFDLVASTEQHVTIPTGATVAVFASTGNFYVLTNGQTAAVPVASNTSFPSPNTNPELDPTVLSVVAGNLLSVIGPTTGTIVTVSFYQDTGDPQLAKTTQWKTFP